MSAPTSTREQLRLITPDLAARLDRYEKVERQARFAIVLGVIGFVFGSGSTAAFIIAWLRS